ncbi:MAG: acyl--CoA ligase [Bacteroidaceae bacterium]|nr:acyl--CoA ligase [Bacteroidaceae bacterium]
MRLVDYLKEHAARQPQKVAVVSQGAETTYACLWQLVQAKAQALRADGVGQGRVVVFRTTQDLEFLVTYFAIHLCGAVAMPLEQAMPTARFSDIERRYTAFSPPPGVADILFTTGTTGDSKGVMVGHGAIMANAENLVLAQGFTDELVFIICGPLNHIGSLSKIFPVVMTGGTLYLLEGLKDLNRFYEALGYPCAKMATFMVPASIRILLQLSGKRLSGYSDKVDFIETGGAPISQADMQALCKALPYSRLYSTYASTETGIVSTYNFNDGRCVAGCLGHHMKNTFPFITPEGRVAVRGLTLMSGYADDVAQTAKVLRDGAVYTADNGTLDADGRLFLTGRNDDVINIGGFKVSPSEVEDVALSFPSVKDCICVCAHSEQLGNILKLLVVTDGGTAIDKQRLARHLAQTLERYKVPQLYEQVGSIRRTYNGKLDRKAYR